MGNLNEFIIKCTIFLNGLLLIGVGRILGALHSNIDQILAHFLVIGGVLVIFCLFVTIILTWRRSNKEKM
jgi:hypothetical protein